MTKQDFEENLQDRVWRLSHLYWIKDEKGNRIPFRLNKFQKYLIEHLWFLNIILKARQLGITTFFCILFLDDVLWLGVDAGFIAHTLDDAKRIFDNKIRYAWDNLPEEVKSEYSVDANSARELKFTKGKIESSIYVGTSLRSGTVQRLHVSELGTIDQKYPNKADEIRTGALNTVHKGEMVVIESTAKGQAGSFFDFCNIALENKRMKRKLTELDWKFFFFPWWENAEYRIKGVQIFPKEMTEYFLMLEQKHKIVLDEQQRNWYYLKWKTQQDAMRSEYPSTPEEAFFASLEGAYYGKQMAKAMEQGRIGRVPYDNKLKVDTWWDLGIASKKTDAMSIWFTQDYGLEIRLIDFYSNSGEGLLHYKKVLDNKEYIYNTHNAPHDIMVKEMGSGKTRFETAADIGLRFDVVEKLPFSDGISAVRMILPKCWFDEKNCAKGIRALMSYRKEWDDNLGKFRDRPLNDWACDASDAFRMLAVGHKDHIALGYYDPELEELSKIKEADRRQLLDPLDPFAL